MLRLALIMFLSLSFCSFESSAQGAKLMLTDIQIAQSNGKYEKYANKDATLSSHIPVTILLYRENNVSYYITALFTQRGKKLKLKVSDYVMHNDEKIAGKPQVFKQKISNNLQDERMMGVRDEEIIYNADMESSLRIVYRFEILYLEDNY